MAYQISFGQISDRRVFESEEYLKWNDGVKIKEVTASLIGKLANEISQMFGYDKITVEKKWLYISWDEAPVVRPFINVAIYYEKGHLVFNTFFLSYVANFCGIDAIVGILSHEIGHRLVYLALSRKGVNITGWENELCSDFVAGLIMRLSSRDISAMENFFTRFSDKGSATHPDAQNRIAALKKGYDWVDRDARGVFLRIPSFAQNIETRSIFTSGVLQELFENEIIKPFRKAGGNLR